MSVIGEGKKTEPIKVWLDEQTLLDLAREANRENRKLSELIRHICRLHLYGHCRLDAAGGEGAERGD